VYVDSDAVRLYRAGKAFCWHAVGVGCANSKRRGVTKLRVTAFKNLNEEELSKKIKI
jgi:hypothetical protein